MITTQIEQSTLKTSLTKTTLGTETVSDLYTSNSMSPMINSSNQSPLSESISSVPDQTISNPSLTIQHVVSESRSSRKSNAGGFFYCLIKLLMKKEGKILIIISLYSLFSTVGGSFMYKKYSSLNKNLKLSPILGAFEGEVDELRLENDHLKASISKLMDEISHLTGEIERLEEENKRYQTLNSLLESNTTDFEQIIDDLLEENDQLELTNTQMNVSNVMFQNLIEELKTDNIQFSEHIQELKLLNTNLNTEVRELNILNMNLTHNLEVFSDLNDDLEENVETLNSENLSLQSSIKRLDSALQDLSAQNAQFKALNEDLKSVVTFLNSTASNIEESLDEIVSYLATLIENYRSLALKSLEINYQTKTRNFACDLSRQFHNEKFVTEPSSSLNEYYPIVLDFIETKVLSEVCADIGDFMIFLDDEVGMKNTKIRSMITFEDVVHALEIYTSLLQDFYFSNKANETDNTVTDFEWEDASFNCDELSVRFRFNL